MAVMLTNAFKTSEGNGDKLEELMKSWVESVLQNPACSSMIIGRDPENSDKVWAFEVWDSKQTHEKFVQEMIADGGMDSPEMAIVDGMPESVYYQIV